MDYHLLREIADSWVLLAMMLFFVGAVVWILRPGGATAHDDAANIPFRNETAPDACDEKASRPAENREART